MTRFATATSISLAPLITLGTRTLVKWTFSMQKIWIVGYMRVWPSLSMEKTINMWRSTCPMPMGRTTVATLSHCSSLFRWLWWSCHCSYGCATSGGKRRNPSMWWTLANSGKTCSGWAHPEQWFDLRRFSNLSVIPGCMYFNSMLCDLHLIKLRFFKLPVYLQHTQYPETPITAAISNKYLIVLLILCPENVKCRDWFELCS